MRRAPIVMMINRPIVINMAACILWEAAKEGCKMLGAGWRLPTDAEWRAMAKEYGGAV